MKCPGCGSDMEEKKSYPDTPGLSTIKRRETCPKCGKTFNLDTMAYFVNAEKKG
jgi:transcriptional regulator NrdR family protein